MPESNQPQGGTSDALTVDQAAGLLESFAEELLSDDESEDRGRREPKKPEPKDEGKKPEADEEPEPEVEEESEEEGDEPKTEETESEEDEPSETDTEETPETEEPDDNKTEKPDLFSVKIDGKEEQVTLDELKKGYSREGDYTRKTQALAEQRKQVEADHAEVRQHRETYAQQLQALHTILTAYTPQEPDWDAVRREAPEQYPRLYADWQRSQARLASVVEAQQRVAGEQAAEGQQQLAQRIVTERESLYNAMPEWREPVKAKAARDEIAEYGRKVGFTDQDLNSVVDHRALLTLWKAMQYDKGQASQQSQRAAGAEKINKVKSGVKTAKPGPQQSRTGPTEKVRKALAQARKTGSIDDTAAALEQMLPDDF